MPHKYQKFVLKLFWSKIWYFFLQSCLTKYKKKSNQYTHIQESGISAAMEFFFNVSVLLSHFFFKLESLHLCLSFFFICQLSRLMLYSSLHMIFPKQDDPNPSSEVADILHSTRDALLPKLRANSLQLCKLEPGCCWQVYFRFSTFLSMKCRYH